MYQSEWLSCLPISKTVRRLPRYDRKDVEVCVKLETILCTSNIDFISVSQALLFFGIDVFMSKGDTFFYSHGFL